MAASASSAPVRVGLRPTFSTTTSLPSTERAATSRNVAEDEIARHGDGHGAQAPAPPRRIDDDRIRRRVGRDGRAQEAQHALGVIARLRGLAQLGAATRLQAREHERALELRARDGQVVAQARERAAAHATSGGNTSPGRAGSTRPSMTAPIWRSGSASRRMGRFVSEASPSSAVSNGRPASSPVIMRIVVPELPQSSAPAAARRPSKPTPLTSASVPSSRIATPSASSARAVDRLSPPSPRPWISTAPSHSAPKSSAR